jgi:hypothetical protein
MSWEKRHLIHIDHIKPCSSFDLTKRQNNENAFTIQIYSPYGPAKTWQKDPR